MASPPTGESSEAGKVRSITSGEIKWTDILDATSTEMAMLARDYHFHPLDLEDCLSERQLMKVEDHGDYIFVSLAFPDQVAQGVIASRHVSMFLGKDYLVTIQPSDFRALSSMFQACAADEKKRAAWMKSSTYLVYQIIDRLVDGIFSILDNVQVSLDGIEAVVFDEKKSLSRPINATRRQIAVLRRIVYPLGLYLPDLTKTQRFSEEDLSIYFDEIRHKIVKVSAMIEEMKELVEIYNDTDFDTSNNRTNTVLSILTIIFTLTIPATVISSIYGMNVPLPGGAVTGPTGFLGIYTSMTLIYGAMLIPAILMAVYFKRVGWF
jgi:magnesium transporter